MDGLGRAGGGRGGGGTIIIKCNDKGKAYICAYVQIVHTHTHTSTRTNKLKKKRNGTKKWKEKKISSTHLVTSIAGL